MIDPLKLKSRRLGWLSGSHLKSIFTGYSTPLLIPKASQTFSVKNRNPYRLIFPSTGNTGFGCSTVLDSLAFLFNWTVFPLNFSPWAVALTRRRPEKRMKRSLCWANINYVMYIINGNTCQIDPNPKKENGKDAKFNLFWRKKPCRKIARAIIDL